MGTEVMRPHDCLIERLTPFHRRKIGPTVGNGAFYPRYRKTAVRAEKKRTIPVDPKRSPNEMGRVTILRRGESMGSLNSKIRRDNSPVPAPVNNSGGDDLVGFGTQRLGPEQSVMVSRPFGDVYAGSAFSNSPSPRSLPVPSFFSNANKKEDGFDDSATRHLRQLLRLE